ncbi:AAA family ATPase [Microbacterium sp. NPDC058021]|uniref:AAA family ATPase n=1 Tax=Microbacterium sp. NPDC058021 TaxID=3346306 RepID=UPI0036DBE3BF
MRFYVESGHAPDPNHRGAVRLTRQDWDDWFKYATLYSVEYIDAEGREHYVGNTKIGRFGLKPARARDAGPGERTPAPPSAFDRLPADFFSLGQDPSYYEDLTKLGGQIREAVLLGLRDIAHDPDLLRQAESEDVTRVSLLRTVPLPTVRDQFARLARGGARLTPYELSYSLKYSKPKPVRIEFSVTPGAVPPTNVHVLIGRNGVGKSTFLNRLAKHLVQKEARDAPDTDAESAALANLVSVSFSAFDEFEPIPVPQDRTKGLTYHYVGLKKIGGKKDDPFKSHQALASEMTRSAKLCLDRGRRQRWLDSLRLLESDPIFGAAGIADTIEEGEDEAEILDYISDRFRLLSSGHKIVLLTMTRLVETVEEKSLVLLDEPEAHLHPPLLSAFVRALSSLLIDRNGVAIVATHSPVVLQEVPRSCVWRLDRNGKQLSLARPTIETFGENVGTLTNEIFGLEVISTGFHGVLEEVVSRARTYEASIQELDGQVGAEGRAILRAMVNAAIEDTNVAH